MSMKRKGKIAAWIATACLVVPMFCMTGCGAPSEYTKIFDKLAEVMPEYNVFDELFGGLFGGGVKGDVMYDNEATAEKDYSDTNVQVAGVQEGDIIKTNGDYIYIISGNKVNIIKADEGKTQKVGQIEYAEEDGKSVYPFAIYLYGSKLIVLKSMHERLSSGYYYSRYYYGSDVCADFYDVSDPSAPVKKHSFSQNGNYVSSRLVGGKLLFLSNCYVYRKDVVASKPETYVPAFTDDGKTYPCAASDVYVPEDCNYPLFTAISLIDIEGGARSSTLCVLDSSNVIYCSDANLYLTKFTYKTSNNVNSQATRITKIALGEKLEVCATATIDGSVDNQFYMDENNGYLRVVSSCQQYAYVSDEYGNMNYVSRRYTKLTVLDDKLQETGSVSGIAVGESLQSVRFYGDTAYVVTFLLKDPLFEINLSDPKNPTLVGELKIPGFSEYMQSFGDKLFGFGKSATEDGAVTGLKLSMFEKVDGLLCESASVSIENGWSEASYNHHAILVNYDKNIICFPSAYNYYVYGFGEEGFYKKAEISVAFYDGWYYSARGLYIDGYFYVATGESIQSFSMTDYSASAVLKF